MKNNYAEILKRDYDYPDGLAEITADEMAGMDRESRDYFEAVRAGKTTDDLAYLDYSVKQLMNDFGLCLPAAVLALSQLKSNYDAYSELLGGGIK